MPVTTDDKGEVSSLLRDLWRRRAAVLATNVAVAVREHREIAHAAALIGEDYYDRFLVELIQNANDQAVLGEARGSTVLVVRTEHCVAVSNGGQAVTGRNLERISSLADSDKTGLLIGNKGVGFKAVYQVTDGPEVYSAPDDEPDTNVFDRLAVGFALETQPFEDPAIADIVEQDVRVFFADNDGLARYLTGAGHEDPAAAVRPELKKAAGFKFPVPRTADDLARRCTALRVPVELRAGIRTLVVLPLRDEAASATAQRVIDRLVGAKEGERAQAELAVLFLSGVALIVVLDHVRGRRWSFRCRRAPEADSLHHATVEVRHDDEEPTHTNFWLMRADVFDCDAVTAAERRNRVDRSLQQFGLEAWRADDPLHVTVALPKPEPGNVGRLGPAGRFCLGLPTEQSTGLPAHVDARFFAKINREGVNFDQEEGYNGLLLDVATGVFANLLERLRASDALDDRRAATLALHRPEPGPLAERVYADGGIADGKVLLAWGGDHFRTRRACRTICQEERVLLPSVEDVLTIAPVDGTALPERELLIHALDELGTMGLEHLGDVSPHPWLVRADGVGSLVERAAALHRDGGEGWWEPFATALLDAFLPVEIGDQRWLPTGSGDLSSPSSRVFLPASTDTLVDDEEVADVPLRVAATLRFVDGRSLRLREDGRALTPLMTRLAETRLVRRPRKTELVEGALFPALADAARDDAELALDLFAQAVAWIASMKEASRKKLDSKHALVPVAAGKAVRWVRPDDAYLGPGWALDAEYEGLLAAAFPETRLVQFGAVAARLGAAALDLASAAGAAVTLGVRSTPRILTLTLSDAHPLVGYHHQLDLRRDPTVGRPELDPFVTDYLRVLCRLGTSAKNTIHHGVGAVLWIDGLEHEDRRQAVLDLMLAHPEEYMPHATTSLCRQSGHVEHHSVRQLWAYALASLGWPIFPAERGAGREAIRVPSTEAWLLSDGSRRTAFAKLVNVVPQRFAPAWSLLHKVGVWTVENAPASRLIEGLATLAARLERDHLEGHRDALSLARELYSQLEDRANGATSFPGTLAVPLLRGGKLVATSPGDPEATVLFDDDPGRTRYIEGADRAFRVPVGRDATIDKLHSMFVATWGGGRVIRSSTAIVDLGFTSTGGPPTPFLELLHRAFPRNEVAVELAVLLTLDGDRTLRSERLSRNWQLFRDLQVDVGSFAGAEVRSFYERSSNLLRVSGTLADDAASVVAATWELAGIRSRDLWEGYATALRDQQEDRSATRAFLRDREITEVEIVDVADAAGLHRKHSVDGLECALLAVCVHLRVCDNLNGAAVWWSGVAHSSPSAVAESLGRPELAGEIARAVSMQSPNGDLHLLRHMEVPWGTWQAAVLRRDGRIYRFERSVARFRLAMSHLLALVRELAVRDPKTDLDLVATALDRTAKVAPSDNVAGTPPDTAPADREALDVVLAMLADHPRLRSEVAALAEPPWEGDLPVPEDTRKATRRGVALYRDRLVADREVEARSTVEAVLKVASILAPTVDEQVDSAVASIPAVARLTTGPWAHVYAALSMLRDALIESAPRTTARLSEIRAFHGATRAEPLLARLTELVSQGSAEPAPKQRVLGAELTATDLRNDLAAGSDGTLGAMLAKAAAKGMDPTILTSSRSPLPEPGSGTGGKGGDGGNGGGGGGGKPPGEPQLIGDLGEAFVHEWLSAVLQEGYGPESWRSKSRERYGLPPCGEDGLGYDFEVRDPDGKLFNQRADRVLIEVKATRTDGSGPFPMSRPEWELARRSHEEQTGALYVILRVFYADTAPCIGDVVVDPFAAHRRGEVRLAERDFWVTVAPPRPPAPNSIPIADTAVGET